MQMDGCAGRLSQSQSACCPKESKLTGTKEQNCKPWEVLATTTIRALGRCLEHSAHNIVLAAIGNLSLSSDRPVPVAQVEGPHGTNVRHSRPPSLDSVGIVSAEIESVTSTEDNASPTSSFEMISSSQTGLDSLAYTSAQAQRDERNHLKAMERENERLNLTLNDIEACFKPSYPANLMDSPAPCDGDPKKRGQGMDQDDTQMVILTATVPVPASN